MQHLRHKGVKWITLGWAGFITENLVLSHNRDWIIEEFGQGTYFNAYGTLSTLATGSIFFGYLRHGRRQGPVFASVKQNIRNVSSANVASVARKLRGTPARVVIGGGLQLIGLAIMSQLAPKLQVPVTVESDTPDLPSGTEGPIRQPTVKSQGTRVVMRCPFDFAKDDSDNEEELYTGVHRITRHPGLWGLGLCGLGAAVLTPFIAEAVFFSMPCLFALIGGAHQDYRHRRNSGGYLSPEDDKKTSNVPFVALALGHQSADKLGEEIKWTNLGAAALAVAGWRLNAARILSKVVA